jgi:hypothetical protein
VVPGVEEGEDCGERAIAVEVEGESVSSSGCHMTAVKCSLYRVPVLWLATGSNRSVDSGCWVGWPGPLSELVALVGWLSWLA